MPARPPAHLLNLESTEVMNSQDPKASGTHRKLAAIMFTDMVGYSALMQKDESLAIGLLDEQRAILRIIFPRHDGVEVETVGDAFLVEFDSAINAVRCAVAIQETLHNRNTTEAPGRTISVRIGIHLGDILQRDGAVVGDGVNVASRIHAEAGPGQIMVSEDVARQVRNNADIRLVGVGEKNLKNIGTPVELFLVHLPWTGDGPAAGSPDVRRSKIPMKWLVPGALAAIAVLLVYLLLPATTGSGPKKSVGVLPLRNLGSADDGYFAEGMTDAISSELSKIGGVRVSITPSSFRFREGDTGWEGIADMLGVETLLDGSAQRDGERVKIDVRLIDPTTGEALWNRKYQRIFRDIFVLQEEIAGGVASGLEARFFGEDLSMTRERPAGYFEAYDLYMRGRYHWNRRSPAEIAKALELFNEAVERDSQFALAYVGIADCYSVFGSPEYGVSSPDGSYPVADRAVRRALAIDGSLAEAHATLASILFNYDWNWPEAGEHFRRAIELNPNYAAAHMWYGDCLTALGMFDSARVYVDRARFLDPLNLTVRTSAGVRLYFSGKFDSALTILNEIRKMDSTYVPVYLWLGLAYDQAGHRAAALNSIGRGLVLSGGSPVMLAVKAILEAHDGNATEARRIIGELDSMSGQMYVSPYYLGEIYQALGETPKALSLFQQAVREKSGAVVYMKVNPALADLRQRSDFNTILRSAGLE